MDDVEVEHHEPGVAGDYFNYSPLWSPASAPGTGSHPLFVPSSPSVNADDYSLDFLPGGATAWTVVDSRGGLLLMNGAGPGHVCSGFPDMVVCEPRTWRYRWVPPPPGLDLDVVDDDDGGGLDIDFVVDDDDGCFRQSCLIDGDDNDGGGCFRRSYLIDGDASGRIGMSSFRVLCELAVEGRAHVAVFAAAGGGDAGEGSSSWGEVAVNLAAPNPRLKRLLGRAAGCWYFHDAAEETLVVLDGRTGELTAWPFLAVDRGRRKLLLPYEDGEGCSCVTDGGDGEPRLVDVLAGGRMDVFTRRGGGEWALEKSVLLPKAARCLPGFRPSFFYHRPEVVTAGLGFVVLAPSPTSRGPEPWCVSVDLGTMEVALAPDDMGAMVYRCELPPPPPLPLLDGDDMGPMVYHDQCWKWKC
ncbi:hypothetical protein ACP4OV_022859 [Aristida adscensionis]